MHSVRKETADHGMENSVCNLEIGAGGERGKGPITTHEIWDNEIVIILYLESYVYAEQL